MGGYKWRSRLRCLANVPKCDTKKRVPSPGAARQRRPGTDGLKTCFVQTTSSLIKSKQLWVQSIGSRGQKPRLYVSFPLALAAAIGLEAGEAVQWELLDRARTSLGPGASGSAFDPIPSEEMSL